MLDVARLDEAARRGPEVVALIEEFRSIETARKELQGTLDHLRAQRNSANKRMAALDKKSDEFAGARDEMREVSKKVKTGEHELDELEVRSHDLHMHIPNAPHERVPDGDSEDQNQEVLRWGEKPSYDFAPKTHWEVGEALGILDFEAGAKLSGARFCVLRDHGSRLNRALISFMLDVHGEGGYREVWPPALVKRHALEGTGQLPKFEEDAFKTAGDSEYFLIPTGEVPVTSLHADEILNADQLPIKYTAYTPCFRAEAGSYGKDTRGLIRQHQFDKVELVQFVEPGQSYEALVSLRESAEEILRRLGLHYRVVNLCTGDLGFCASQTFDIEVWLPGQDTFREISSCSNFEDYQARRAKIRYRPESGAKAKMVHTVNGSGLAVGRTIVAILEQNQRADGSVAIPKALQPYMGGLEVIEAPSAE
ncbi:MAG: serine--tRNA ligase [Myxococcales bacterium]|nr:serine--tRNA ligase [Myxococcales bacterium]